MVLEMPQDFAASFGVESREVCSFHSPQAAAAQTAFRRAQGPWRSHGAHNPWLVPTAKALVYFLGPTCPKKNQVWVVSIHLEAEVASSAVSRKSQLAASTLSSSHSSHHKAMIATPAPFVPRRAVATSSFACPVGRSTPTESHLPSAARSVTASPVQVPFAVRQPFEGVGLPT